MNHACWHLITGEYPPRPGGISDHTALVASALAGAGSEVHVWTARIEGAAADEVEPAGVAVHRPIARWAGADLRRLDAALDAFAPPRRLVVHYTPNVWGFKGLNLGFCRWLVRRRDRGDDVRVMFHEVWYTLQPRDRPARRLLVLGQRLMARTLMDACSSAYVSTPGWEPLLLASERRKGPRRAITWLPIPSNIAVVDDAAAVDSLKRRLAPGGETLVGSFGTFGGMIGDLLAPTLPRLLEGHADRLGLLVGRGSDRFAARLAAECPALAGRLIAAAGLPPAEVSTHLQACDLMVQPYPDGVTSRRTSLAAALEHGVAAVSNLGARSEPIWAQTGGVALAAQPDPAALAATAERLLACKAARDELGARAREVYQQYFAIERLVATMTGQAEAMNQQVGAEAFQR
jgi:glycosyltransferase involved in cell wall biosynthesis